MLSGITIAHRFALGAPGGWHVPGATSWAARDTRLDAPVTVLVADVGDPEAVLAVLTRARGVRDPRLARIIDVGIADMPATEKASAGKAHAGKAHAGTRAAIERRAYVAVAALPDPTTHAILESRVLPASLARLVIRGVADALGAARGGGLAHGALSPAAIGVTSRGRVIVAGAGLAPAFGGDDRSASADDARALATLFTRAVLGLGDAGADDLGVADDEAETALLDDLTRTERRLVKHVLRGQYPRTVDELVGALGESDGATLSAIRTQLRRLPHLLVAEERAAAPEAVAAEDVAAEDVAADGAAAEVLEREEREAEREAATHERGAPPAGATAEEIEEWELEHLLEAQEAEELPTLTEAIFDLLHRRFPRSARITGYLEAAHARALEGPRINGSKWTLLALVVFVTILGVIAVEIFNTPFVPKFDLHNPPPQSYPSFTFSPSPTGVTPSP